MMTKVCEKCDHEMRLIPAGISKTKNKPYAAFWSCDQRNGGCGATARAEGEAAMPAPAMSGSGDERYAMQDRLSAIEAKLDELISLVKNGA
jgi:hypothetical protein